MACYAGLKLLLLVCLSSICLATGNIGCLFSETLCNQEKEWCFDDFAFGKCLPLYGRLQEQNMFRYDLQADELHSLEQEMQRLFLLGYRWSHTYTQCMLQVLLTGIREKSDVDVSVCNVELDQDLEGALKAIEGDEIESIDPQNLAIVRFRPSVIDPHSDYADELYYPPGKEVLLPFRPIDVDSQQASEAIDEAIADTILQNANLDGRDELIPERSEPSPVEFPKFFGDFDQPLNRVDDYQDEFPNEQWTMAIPEQFNVAEDRDYPVVLDDYDTEPYRGFPQDVMLMDEAPRKRSETANPIDPVNNLRMSKIFKKLLRRTPLPERNLHELTKLLTNIRHGVPEGIEERTHVTGEPMYYPSKEKQSYDMDYGDNGFDLPKESYGKKVTSKTTSHNEKNNRASYKSGQITGYNPYLSSTDSKVGDVSQLPELMPPKHETLYIPDEIHPRYEPVDTSSKSAEKPKEKTFEEERKVNQYYDNGVTRFSETGKPMKHEKSFQRNEDRVQIPWEQPQVVPQEPYYDMALDYGQRYGDGYAIPPQNYPVYTYNPGFYQYYDYGDYGPPTELQKNVKKDDEVPDYGQILPGRHTTHKYDEKKPGPPFKQPPPSTYPNYGDLVREPELLYGGGDWMRPMTRWLQRDSFYPMLRSGGPYYEQADNKFLDDFSNYDLLRMSDAMLDDGYPGLRLPIDHMGGYPDYQDDNTYVYITTKDKFEDQHKAQMMVKMILHYTGIKDPHVDQLRVKGNMLAFEIPENSQRVTPEEIAEKIEEVRGNIQEKTGIEITQTGVGSPTRWLPRNNFYPMMGPGGPFYEQSDRKYLNGFLDSDSVHMDEAILDKAIDGSQRHRGQKEGLPVPSKHMGGAFENEDLPMKDESIEKNPYVYITINGEFENEGVAKTVVNMILHSAGIKDTYVKDLSVKKNHLTFKLPENTQGVTPAQLAERIEEIKQEIKDKTDIEIIQSGIGNNKDGMAGYAYEANNRQMETAAAIVCGVCGALLVSATVLYLVRRQSKSRAKLQGITSLDTEASKDYQDLCRARMATKDCKDGPTTTTPAGHATAQRISSLSKESDNGNNSPSSRSSTSSWSEEPVASNMDISTGHMVLSYMEDHLRNKDRLEQEWIDLCAYEAEPSNTSVALSEEFKNKNRYPDTVPYDHNRVMLNDHTNANGSNYINASSITDHDPRNPVYIATQGPIKETTPDFWQLVWEQGSVVIVMLTRLNENGQAMCHRYWPEEGSELYHIYEVHLVSEHIWCDDYLVRSFYLKNIRSGETRTVTQFHFLSWTEAATPSSTKALLEFRRKVNKSYRGRSCPIIVHCNDGAGRSGTYCLIDMVLNRMVKGSKEIDIAATLEHIRDQRPLMVKTKAQFEFVLMAVAEEVHAILKALPQ